MYLRSCDLLESNNIIYIVNFVLQLSHKKTAHQNLPVPHSNKHNNISLKRNTVKKITRKAKQAETTKKATQTVTVRRVNQKANRNRNNPQIAIQIAIQISIQTAIQTAITIATAIVLLATTSANQSRLKVHQSTTVQRTTQVRHSNAMRNRVTCQTN